MTIFVNVISGTIKLYLESSDLIYRLTMSCLIVGLRFEFIVFFYIPLNYPVLCLNVISCHGNWQARICKVTGIRGMSNCAGG